MQIFNFDLSTKNITQVLNVKQGDVGRKFKVVITDRGVAYAIPTGAHFSVWFSGPSGEGNYSAIGERTAFAVDGNTVTVELIAQMLANHGTGSMCLVLSNVDGTQLGLWNMIYAVEHVPGMGSKAAEEYYSALSELAKQAIESAATFKTDLSLSVGGRAADAAAVGAKFATMAPAGFGLGEGQAPLPPNNDVHSIRKNGWYLTKEDTVNAPSTYGAIYAVVRDNTNITLFYEHIGTTTTRLVKCMVYGTWGEWEWVNPPMTDGAEYRTTERWNGKAVWTCLLNLGTAPNNTESKVDHNISMTRCLRCMAIDATSGMSLPRVGANGDNLYVYCGVTKVTMYSTYNFSDRTIMAQVWYTKD